MHSSLPGNSTEIIKCKTSDRSYYYLLVLLDAIVRFLVSKWREEGRNRHNLCEIWKNIFHVRIRSDILYIDSEEVVLY
jgi:hypothetical protein